MAEVRVTANVLKVLGVVMSAGGGVSGATIARATGLQSGTLYPMLLRLEGAGWLSSQWEIEEPGALGRPRRRFYSVTAKGAAHAKGAASELAPIVGKLATT